MNAIITTTSTLTLYCHEIVILIVHNGRARYNVTNDGVEFSLSPRGVAPSDYNPANPHYDRVDNMYEMIPHYEQETFTTNEVQ